MLTRDQKLELLFLKQAQTARLVSATLPDTHCPRVNPSLSHSHWCRHCDMVLACVFAECILPHDISKLHRCGEREDYNRRMIRLLRNPDCKHKCSGECNHPRKEPYLGESKGWEYQRPQIEPTIKAFHPIELASDSKRIHSEDCCCKVCIKAFKREQDERERLWEEDKPQ